MKRIVLFLATNLAILVLLGIVLTLVEGFLASQGVQLPPNGAILLFAFIFGMGGAFISLAMSKWVAKRFTGARVIEQPRDATEQWLVETVRRQARQAGIGMPEVAVYDAPEINAFATGMSKNNALVAVSTGLLRGMNRDEAEAVLGHEVSHIANGDMVTLTLIQGVLNTFVIFLARVIGGIIDRTLFRREDDGYSGYGIGYFAIVIVLEIIFGLLASMIVMWFSRYREFRADAGGAKLAGRDKMIAALQRLQSSYGHSHLPEQVKSFGITPGKSGLMRLFMSHPPLEERIAALRQARA
jgi:heat shock protein HtpX